MSANLHIVLNHFTNDSRVLKETRSIASFGLFDAIHIAALWEEPLSQVEWIEPGRIVWRVPLRSRRWPKSLIFQFIKYLEWLLRMGSRYRREKVHVVHAHDLSALPAAVLFKGMMGAKIVYDAHEFETEQEANPPRLRKGLQVITEMLLIRFVDEVICVSPGIAEAYRKRYGIEPPRLILNCPPFRETRKTDILRKELGIPDGCRIFLFQGGLDRGRDIENILEAFRHGLEGAALVFMGGGPLKEQVEEAAGTLPRVYYREPVPPDILLDYTASADFGFALNRNESFNDDMSLPNKLFEYAMAGVPVIISNIREARRLVERHGIGIVLEDNSPGKIRAAVQQLLSGAVAIDEESLRAFSRLYNWENQERVLEQIYRKSVPCAVSPAS